MEDEHGGDEKAGQGAELGSKLVTIELKRFYVDLKKNERGTFIKIAEVDASGAKSKIILPLVGIEQFKSRLTLLHTISMEIDAAGVENVPELHADPLRTEMMRCENKRFFFDLCSNVRGRFLKISQVMGPRSTVVIPASGILTIRDSISNVMKESGEAYVTPTVSVLGAAAGAVGGGMAAKEMRVEHKRFFFDVGSNQRGTFLRISEVTGSNRASITIPQSGWAHMRDAIDEFIQQAPPPVMVPVLEGGI